MSVGYPNKTLYDAETETPEAPAFDEPEYTSIHKDYKINMGWHQVMSAAANSNLSKCSDFCAGD